MDQNCNCKIKLCPHTNPPRPINLPPDPPPDDSGFLIIRFKLGALGSKKTELAAAAKESSLHALADVLTAGELRAQPLITSLNRAELEKLEQEAMQGDTPPLRSLTSYWRLDARHVGSKLEEIEAALRRMPEIELVYREKTPSDPVNPGDDTYSGSESFLDAAPTGIDARWVWTQPNGDGAGMRFIDLEQGWLLGHEDLPSPTLIFNDNHDGTGGGGGKNKGPLPRRVAG